MNKEQISRFEANIERLIESVFANFFGQKLRAQDIALQLARAMELEARPPLPQSDDLPVAPDFYRIRLNPHLHSYLTQTQPTLQHQLSQHIVMLASQAGYRMTNVPIIELIADPTLEKNGLDIIASHTERPENSTAGLQRVVIPKEVSAQPLNAYLVMGEQVVRLGQAGKEVINIGRHRDNDLVLDDPYVSRHHLQLRLRFGAYMLFDVHSQGGTYVNGVRVKEHQLQAGDVIQLGNSQLVYMEDASHEDSQLSQTDALDPLT